MIVKILGLAIVCACAYMLLSASKSEFTVVIQVAVFAVLAMWAYPYLGKITDLIYSISSGASVNGDIVKTTLKLTGIAIIAGFSSDILEDAGAKSSAQKVALCAKVIMLALVVPYISETVEFLCSLARR